MHMSMRVMLRVRMRRRMRVRVCMMLIVSGPSVGTQLSGCANVRSSSIGAQLLGGSIVGELNCWQAQISGLNCRGSSVAGSTTGRRKCRRLKCQDSSVEGCVVDVSTSMINALSLDARKSSGYRKLKSNLKIYAF